MFNRSLHTNVDRLIRPYTSGVDLFRADNNHIGTHRITKRGQHTFFLRADKDHTISVQWTRTGNRYQRIVTCRDRINNQWQTVQTVTYYATKEPVRA